MALTVIGWILVVAGALAVYLSKFILQKRDEAFDLDSNPEYSYKRLAVYKIGGFVVTVVGIVIIMVKYWR